MINQGDMEQTTPVRDKERDYGNNSCLFIRCIHISVWVVSWISTLFILTLQGLIKTLTDISVYGIVST